MSKKPHQQQTPLAQATGKLLGPGVTRTEQQLVIQQSEYNGQLPHPDILKQFDQHIPGTAAKLILWAEQEQDHRRSLESNAMAANIAAQHAQSVTNAYTARAIFRSDMVGQVCGFLVCLSCVAGALWMGIAGQPWVAGVLGAIPTAAVIQAFRMRPLGRKTSDGSASDDTKSAG